ncbi:hypothetical protein AA0117_g12464 [Alternaria alternata]|uniref:Heterokaryon incompatibility domain-containing protein n=1 Tax=Alternaria alternata TaxID=5599 RepID=A0A4Q4MZ65_ALTAL|nr:hypothetical protein AA0117_g12464 [Alternaria alternata]
MFGNGTLSVYDAYNDVLYLEHHDEHSWNRYALCLELRSGDLHRKYILQNVCTSTQFYLLRKLDSEVIDYEILRHWLRYCKFHHTKCTQTYDSIIPGLRVIDCTTETVVYAPEDATFHYVALSYVWGGTKSSGKDQDEFPATIRDAITVTIRLGYRYLWVDQYCINESSEGHKQAQIQLMGRIYAEAELVIIAAAGSSSSYGLPGVGVKAREAQGRVRLENNVELIEMNEPDRELDMSAWAQRGWTHQEGYLATRSLVFTDKEVLYVCNQGAWQESVQRPAMEDDGQCWVMANACFHIRALPPYNSHAPVYFFLDNYSGRKLSYDSDILNACIGVLNKFVGHHHFWGMVTPRLDPERCLPLCLEWRSRIPGTRREAFPSWSWVATASPKMIPSCGWGDHNEGYVAHIRTNDGRWLSPEEQTESRCDPLPMNFGPTLRLQAMLYTALLSTNTMYGAPDSRPVVIFQATDGDGSEFEVVFKLWLDTELIESDLKNTVKAILVSGSTREDRDIESYSLGPAFMILQAVGHHYKRIGITGYEYRCWILEKRTRKVRMKDDNDILSYEICRGIEETVYIE